MKMVESSTKWVKDTVGKEEIARYEQFLLFLQCLFKGLLPCLGCPVVSVSDS